MKKRMLALLLTLCMVVSLLPAQMVVAEGTVALSTAGAAVIEQGTVSATFTPDTTGTYVFYDTTSRNEGGNEWSIGFPNDSVDVVPNRTYPTEGYRAYLQGGTTYNVEVRNNAGRALSLNVAAAVYGGEISFPASILNQDYNTVGGEWSFEALPVAPNGVLNNTIGWDNGATPCVTMTLSGEYNQNVHLTFVKEGTFTLTATDRVEGSYTKTCSHTINVGPAGNVPVVSPTMAMVAEGALFIVYPVQGEPWDTNLYEVPVAEGETLRNYVKDISMPTHQSEFTKKFDGWMVCTQDPNTGNYVQLPDTEILGLTDILDYPVGEGYTTYFVASWRIEEPEPIKLNPIVLDTPFTVQIDYFPGKTDKAVASFTPAESGYYMVCWSNASQNISANLDGTDIEKGYWYGDSEEGVRWYFESGKTYQIVFSGTTDNGSITYTMKKVPAPTAIAFRETPISAYVGDLAVSAYDVMFTPADAYADVEIAFAEADFVEKNENDRYIYTKAGTTTVTAKCGDLPVATAEVVVSESLTLPLNETVTYNSGDRGWLKFEFTPTASGEYTFDFTANERISCAVDEVNADWSVQAGGKKTCVVTLEAGETYTVWAGEANNVDITAKVTAGSDRLVLTEGKALTVKIPARSSVTAVFEAPQEDYIDYVAYWPAEEGLRDLQLDMRQVQYDGYGYFGYGFQDTPTTYGRTYRLMGDYTYHLDLTNPTDVAMEFEFMFQQPVTDTDIELRTVRYDEGVASYPDLPAVVRVNMSEYACVVPVAPNGALDAITWKSSDTAVVTLDYSVDHPENATINFVGEGEATVTVTNSANGKTDSHTFYVFAQDAQNNMILDANGGLMNLVTKAGQHLDTNYFGLLVPAGKNLEMVIQSITEPTNPNGAKLLGWLPHVQTDNGPVPVENAVILETADVMKYPAVADQVIVLVAQWEGGGEGGGQVPDFVIPEDATVTKMTSGTKYDVPAQQDTFFTFTAPAKGLYSLNSNAENGIFDELYINVRQMFTDNIFDGKNSVFSMEEGQTIEVMAQAPKACKLWLEKEIGISKMEIVSQDKTSTYLMNADPRLTLEDVKLKLTYEDGTTEIINGFDLIVFGDTYKGMPVLVEMVVDVTTADVFVTCGLVQIQYQVKLEPRMVVGFEAIPAKDFPDIYENTMGFEMETPDGTSSFYVYEEATNCAYSFATYRFTWSDSTVEEFHLPMEGANHFHGVPVHIDDVFDPYSNPWSVGTHTLPIRFGDLTDTLDIEIKANNVASIELEPGVKEYTLGDPDYFENTDEGWVMNGYDLSGFKLKVTYKDGTAKVLTEADITDFRGMFGLLDNTMVDGDIEQKVHAGPGTNKIYMRFMGKEAEAVVNIVEVTVEDGNIIIPETAVDEALAEKKDDTVTLDVTTSSTAPAEEKTSSAKLPVASVEKLIEEEVKQVVVEMDSAIVTMDAEALEAIAEQAAGASITLSVEQVETTTLNEKQQAAIQEKKVAVVISAELICNETKEPIGTEADGGFGEEGKITVKIPFTPEEGFKGTDYMVYYVADNGTIKEVTTAYADGYLIVELEHLSEYVVVNTADEGEDGGLGDPDDSNDPKPTDPTEPTDPKPTDPTEPSKPTDPTEPSKPTEPKPTEPEETTKPTEPAKPTNPAVPDTGDHSSVTTMMLLMLASGALAVVLLLLLRKKSKA